mmetsp:Transcript_65460/g.80144  ORF Transcript_65460/g.80144 Transcript_65460/m.80144 type:complete len:110 (-) Transcript_65460:8-337(-)
MTVLSSLMAASRLVPLGQVHAFMEVAVEWQLLAPAAQGSTAAEAGNGAATAMASISLLPTCAKVGVHRLLVKSAAATRQKTEPSPDLRGAGIVCSSFSDSASEAFQPNA